MSATRDYINALTSLKSGDLGLLRSHAGQGIDESAPAFDLFAGLWWPLRKKTRWVPRRNVAWLIAKLYAQFPIEHSPGETLARQLRRCLPSNEIERQRFELKFDGMLALPIEKIEPALQWALGLVGSRNLKLDWVRLATNLSYWDRPSIRLQWVRQFLETLERR